MRATQNHSLCQQRERGAALIIALLMLLVMTLLGISSVMTTTMEEKMAGNTRNKHMSFQAAETALRAGEGIAANLSDTTVFDGTDGLYSRSEPDDTDYPIWEQASGIAWESVSSSSLYVQDPEYLIEDFSQAPRDQDCMLQLPRPPDCMLPLYRITARGWGLNTNAQTVLQSTFKRL